jgi:hypothetical protein
LRAAQFDGILSSMKAKAGGRSGSMAIADLSLARQHVDLQRVGKVRLTAA